MSLNLPALQQALRAALSRRAAWRRAALALAAVKLAVLAVLAMAWLQPATAQAGTDPTAFASATATFLRAAEGVDDAVEPAATQLAQLSQADPQDPVLRAYAGAAAAMRARTAWLPWRKLSHAEDGLAQIDKALAQLTTAHDAPLHRGVPASLETRFTAAGTYLAMPSMMNRQARGAKLLDEVLKSPLLDTAPAPFRAAVWLRAGLQAAKDGQPQAARQWLQKVADSGAPQAALAQAKLKEL
ncbi:MAG: hypothetical protein HY855_13725 [Burkholderiales bacterium]|nr:hypothetical protein [Burkholderiales bacterium]